MIRKFLRISKRFFFFTPLISLFLNLYEYQAEFNLNSKLKLNNDLIKIAQDSVEIVPSIKNVLKFYENYKKFSTIYIISPVNVSNINEKADLTRFLNTLRLIPKMQWIVVENTPEKSEKIKKFLQKSGVNYVHLNRYVKENQVLDKKVSLEQFDEGLNWLRSNYHNIHQDGVVYLAKIQTSYETRIFELMRNTKKVMVWPIGMVNKSLYSRPVCIGQKVVSWYCPWKCQDNLYPIHESGFAINLKLIAYNNEQFVKHRERGDFYATFFLKNLVNLEELEAPECNKIYVRNIETKDPIIVYKKAKYDQEFLKLV